MSSLSMTYSRGPITVDVNVETEEIEVSSMAGESTVYTDRDPLREAMEIMGKVIET